jgi:hypothetical protein
MKKSVSCIFVILVPLLFFQVVQAQFVEKPKTPVLYDESRPVYVLIGDDVFHKENCKLLTGNKAAMNYRLALEKGYKPCLVCFADNIQHGYKWDFSLLKPNQSKVLAYSDQVIDIAFIVLESQIGFEIANKTDKGIKVNWDEISFISPDGRSSRIIHSGIRLIDRNNPQAPTMVPPESHYSDIMIPSENIIYAGSGWQTGKLFSGDSISFNEKDFGLYLPLEIKGEKQEYSFRFKISVSEDI